MHRRGGGLLLSIGALILVGSAGGFAYWITHREQKSSLLIFHWVPGPGPLKLLGAPPYYPSGEDLLPTLDPRLLDLLRENAGGGELRLMAEFATSKRLKSGACAVLLTNLPTAPLTVALVDRRASLYIDQGAGLQVLPESSSATGATIVLTLDSSKNFFKYATNDGRGSGTDGGVVPCTWW